ncbi:hypothetical protein B0T26DRAFT_844663, partial [Lasiosphaeria miniovina]
MPQPPLLHDSFPPQLQRLPAQVRNTNIQAHNNRRSKEKAAMKYLHATNALLLRSPSSALLSRSSPPSSSAAATLAIISACRALSSSTSASAYSSYSSTNKPAAFAARRPFSHTARAHAKKGSKRGGRGGDDAELAAVAAGGGGKGKKDKKSSSSGSDTAGDADRPLPNGEDPFNLADVTYAFDKAERHHGEELKRMRTGGGKFNAEVIGALPVQ